VTTTTKGAYVSALDKLKGLGGLDPLGGGKSGLNLLFEDGNGALNFIASIAGRDNTSIVSAPQIVAISDEEAEIDVTDEKPVEEVNFDSNGNPTTSSWTKIDASTTLSVVPHITANNEVTLEVEQKYEEFGQPVTGGGENPSTSYPVLRRSLKTKLVVPDGKTVLFGGMIKNKATENIQGIPLLMDIPWLGEFFKYTKKGVNRNELLVLLTVNVIDNETRISGLLKRYNQSLRAADKVLSDEASLGEPLNIIDDVIERQEELKKRRERKALMKDKRKAKATSAEELAPEDAIVITEE
jgi:type II secretory pathway component GspD/PulD (secretin)